VATQGIDDPILHRGRLDVDVHPDVPRIVYEEAERLLELGKVRSEGAQP
jgi:hypothetical protein